MSKMRFLAPIGILAIAAGFGAVVMLLWNWLASAIFGLGVINYWQALGLLVLCRILFGSFGGWHHARWVHGWHHGGRMHGLRDIRKKWMNMTPGQREEFIRKTRSDFFGTENFDSGAGENTRKDNE